MPVNRVAEFTETFKTALLSRERRPLAQVTYYDLDWQVQEVVTGEVAADSGFAMDEQGRRTARIRLKNSDGSRTPDPASEIWYGRFSVEWGLRTKAGDEYVQLGRFIASSPGVQVGAAVGWAVLGLADKAALWGTFKDFFVISAGTNIAAAIKAIALDAGEVESNLNLYPTSEEVGAEVIFHPGDGRWESARKIAVAAQETGYVLNLTYDSGGLLTLYLELDPSTTTGSSWTFQLADGITTQLDKTWESNDFANRIQVYGGSGKSATVFSEIADTSTGAYGAARRGDWCFKWPQGQELDPLITTQARADARRDYLYRIKRTSQELIRLGGLVIPGFSLSDVVTIMESKVSRTNAKYIVGGGYSFGLGPSGSMALAARRVVTA